MKSLNDQPMSSLDSVVDRLNALFFKRSSIKSWLPRLQSHRGYHVGPNPIQENTLKSIQKAFELGYEIVEFDVHLTRDHVVVLHHDASIEKTVIGQTLFADLISIKAMDTLEDVFIWLAAQTNKKLKLNIELKSRSITKANLEKAVCNLIEKYQLQGQILISSFNPLALVWVRFYEPNVYRALLLTYEVDKDNTWMLQKMILNFLVRPHALHLRYQNWNKSSFFKINEKVPVVLWTCNDLEFYQAIKGDIYGIISDEITPQVFNQN